MRPAGSRRRCKQPGTAGRAAHVRLLSHAACTMLRVAWNMPADGAATDRTNRTCHVSQGRANGSHSRCQSPVLRTEVAHCSKTAGKSHTKKWNLLGCKRGCAVPTAATRPAGCYCWPRRLPAPRLQPASGSSSGGGHPSAAAGDGSSTQHGESTAGGGSTHQSWRSWGRHPPPGTWARPVSAAPNKCGQTRCCSRGHRRGAASSERAAAAGAAAPRRPPAAGAACLPACRGMWEHWCSLRSGARPSQHPPCPSPLLLPWPRPLPL